MARQESDREDLFAELAALWPRMELVVGPVRDGLSAIESPDEACEVIHAGMRKATGGWSVFFGPEEVYHFDNAGRLRRSYRQGLLYRSEGTTLSRLRRERTPDQTVLLRTDLSEEELASFQFRMREQLQRLSRLVEEGGIRILRSEPEQEAALSDLKEALKVILEAGPRLADGIGRG